MRRDYIELIRIVQVEVFAATEAAQAVPVIMCGEAGDVATTGNSGSGVFDARQKCLLGCSSARRLC
jgi:hypothetical protein